ncbi:MAG: galactose mutarotase [Lachnospiraceae bacterium]|nr:galactose mutarotase [Lachnospiraceae bacterium]
MKKELFGKTQDGSEVFLYTMENSKGMKASVMNYGAILVNLMVPDKDGKAADVCLGYDRLEDYLVNGCFFGATIGPNGNRIADAKLTIDGTEYQLKVNDGPNNLHSDEELGFHKRIWEAKEDGDMSVVFYLESPDGDMGFPGNKTISVTYTLTENNEIKIAYAGSSDKKTVLNMTNHSYFNLKGHDQGSIEDHILTLNCSNYTPVREGLIPTGEIAPVAGTPMDFTQPKVIGDEIDADFEALNLGGGYDHNWVIDGWDHTIRHFATVEEKTSGRTMKVYTDLPGVQFYAGNFVTKHTGKGGAEYDRRGGLCLETQDFPNAVNEASFPSPVYGEGRDFVSTTIYQFV